MRSWPPLVLAVPAAAEVWSGWVGIAQKTGFGVVCSLGLGMAGQVAFHLMDQGHVTWAPWGITTLVSCLPVLVLGMGTVLAHMLREDAAAVDHPDDLSGGPAGARSPRWSVEDQPADHADRHRDQDRPDQVQPDQVQDQQSGTRITVRTSPSPRTSDSALLPGSAAPPDAAGRVVSSSPDQGGVQASLVALRLATAGKPVSRRALRNGGVKGSNESLNALARQLNAEFANEQAAVP